MGTIPGGLIRLDRSIVISSTMALNFATDGRGGALQASGNTTQRQAAFKTSGNLFALH
jgi:hypothetical protein